LVERTARKHRRQWGAHQVSRWLFEWLFMVVAGSTFPLSRL